MSPARHPLAICLSIALAASIASAAKIRELDISRDDGRYSLVADTYLEAPPQAIFNVLVDYERFDRISSVYKEFGYLEPQPDGTPTVYTLMEGCVVFFCKQMRRVETLDTREPHFIRTTALPERSDFEHSVSEWHLEPSGEGTNVVYKLEMEPDFWVPPVIGPWYLKRTLMRGGTDAVQRIERIARRQEAGAAPAPDAAAE